MTRLSLLTALRERVDAATGPDRELDTALAQALVPDVIVLRQRDDDSGTDPYTHWKYTGSVDDAIALVERLLPGCARKSGFVPDGLADSEEDAGYWAQIFPAEGSDTQDGFLSKGATEPLALLSALLAALIEIEKEKTQ